MLKACIGLNCTRQIDFIDRRNFQLSEVPDEIYRHEATLEELLLDQNAIQELPAKIFRLTNLRKLTISENDIMRLPPMIANFSRLVELDISKNCIEEIPSNLQFCRSLSILDITCNPLMRIPDAIVNISSLTHLYMNDVALPALPREIGNLQNLVVLEARENILRRVPPSIGELGRLRRLDLGNNEIEDLPQSFGYLRELVELWLDSNCLSLLPEGTSQLRNLTILDVTKNKLERFPNNFSQLISLSDLHASENCIEVLPDDFGCLKNLTQLKLDLNHLVVIPDSIGECYLLTEVFLFENMLESVPPSIFNIPNLEMLNLDRNHLMDLPSSVGKCKSLHVLSIRENELMFLPDEIGNLSGLKVLDVCGNRITHLPLSTSNLQLDAFWIAGNQLQPLISLQQIPDPENPDQKVLTCQYLPQRPYSSELDLVDNSDMDSDGGFTQRGRLNSGTRLTVAFEPGTVMPDDMGGGKLVRFPTPFRKELKNKHKKPKLDARPRTTVFKKGSMDDLTINTIVNSNSNEVPTNNDMSCEENSNNHNKLSVENEERRGNFKDGWKGTQPSPLLKAHGMNNLSEAFANGSQQSEDESVEQNHLPPKTKLQTIEVTVDLVKDPSRGGLGFSIAGGKGSTPAYEDVDESIFITRIIRGGVAEKDGRLRLGDKLLLVNDNDMSEATHMQAVTALRGSQKKCYLRVSREVLIVLPHSISDDEDEGSITPVENGGSHRTPPLSPEKTTPTKAVSSLSEPNGLLFTEASTGQSMEPVIMEKEETTENVVAVEKRKSIDTEREAVLLDSDEDVLVVEEEKEEDEEEEEDIVVSWVVDEGTKEREIEYKSHDLQNNSEITQCTIESKQEELSIHSEEMVEDINNEEHDVVLDSGHESPNIDEEIVVLDRQISNLGMSIVGGADYSSKLFGCGQPGIYISKVSPFGSAAATGKLRMGDKILKVNGIDMENASHEKAVECLVLQVGDITLHIRHEPQPPGLMEVSISKEEGDKLGVSIKGGSIDSIGNPFDPQDEGIFISKITKGGVAEMDGRLHVGQRILEVNNVSLLGASHVEAVHTLRHAGNNLTLLVCEGFGISSLSVGRQQLSGSMDVLAQDSSEKRKKHVRTTSASGVIKSEVSQEDSKIDFNKVLQDLTKYQEELTLTLSDKVNEEKKKPQDTPVIQISPENVHIHDTHVHVDEDLPVKVQKRENAEELARLKTEKQEELKSIISEVFSDFDELETTSKQFDNDVTVTERSPSPPSASELSDPQLTSPIYNEEEQKTTHENMKHEHFDEEWTMIELSSDENRTFSVPPNPVSPTGLVYLPERPNSAEGKIDSVDRRRKPAALLAPEKLTFKDRLALHRRKVDNFTKEVEEDTKRVQRRSWTPGGSPRVYHTGSSSLTVSPTSKWPLSSSVGTHPFFRTTNNQLSPDHLANDEKMTRILGDRELTESEKPIILSSPPLSLPINIKDTPISNKDEHTPENHEPRLSVSSDPPLTSSPTSPTLIDDPGFSPSPVEEDDEIRKNITVTDVDNPLNSSYIIDQVFPEKVPNPKEDKGDEKRVTLRDQKRAKMEKRVEHVRALLMNDPTKDQ